MASTTLDATTTQPPTPTVAPGPDLTEAFVADRQAFWGSFTNFVFMGVVGIVVLLMLLAFFLG